MAICLTHSICHRLELLVVKKTMPTFGGSLFNNNGIGTVIIRYFWYQTIKLAESPSLGTLSYRKILQYRISDFNRLYGNNFSTFCGNQVRFGQVTTEFATLECVQQSSN